MDGTLSNSPLKGKNDIHDVKCLLTILFIDFLTLLRFLPSKPVIQSQHKKPWTKYGDLKDADRSFFFKAFSVS